MKLGTKLGLVIPHRLRPSEPLSHQDCQLPGPLTISLKTRRTAKLLLTPRHQSFEPRPAVQDPLTRHPKEPRTGLRTLIGSGLPELFTNSLKTWRR